MNIDLPNLTSIINSEGDSFCNPRSVTLESISEYWILIVFRYSKSPKCQSTWWLFLSIPESSIEINFEYCLIDLISFIDVSPILADLVYTVIPFHSTSFNDHWIHNAYSVCLFQTPYHHSLVIDLGSNHRLTRFHHFITTQIGLASMFQSFVWSMLRMKIRNLWEIEDPNWTNRVWFNVQNRNVLYLIIL